VDLSSLNVRKLLHEQGEFSVEFSVTVCRPESSEFQNVGRMFGHGDGEYQTFKIFENSVGSAWVTLYFM